MNQARIPFGVIVIGVVGIVQGVLTLIAGLALLVERNDADLLRQIGLESGEVGTYAVVAMIVGAVTIMVSLALFRGSGVARVLIGLLQVLHLAGGVYLLVRYEGTYLWDGVTTIIVAAVILFLLFGTTGSRDFFDRSARA